MKSLRMILISGFVVTWTMKFAGVYCGNDAECVKALEGDKTQQFSEYIDAKRLICSLPKGAENATMNGVPASDICGTLCDCGSTYRYPYLGVPN